MKPCHALHGLVTVAADWVQTWVPPVWFDRYRRAVNGYRLPKGKAARYELAAPIGTDGREVLTHLDDPHAPAWLGEIPAVQGLRQVWTQQFYAVAPDAPMRWRNAKALPPAPVLIRSPYDPEARYSKKRETEWVGYVDAPTDWLVALGYGPTASAAPALPPEPPPAVLARVMNCQAGRYGGA